MAKNDFHIVKFNDIIVIESSKNYIDYYYDNVQISESMYSNIIDSYKLK